MIQLVGFSLKRRFQNKMTLFLSIILLVIFLIVGFMDVIIETFKPELFEPIKIRLDVSNEALFKENEHDNIVFDDRSNITVHEQEGSYLIKSAEALAIEQELIIKDQIYAYHTNKLLLSADYNAIQLVDAINNPQIEMKIEETSVNREHDLLFVFITAIYFMMIGFAAMIAQEIVGEKTTNILELIGTSISLKVHYYSKIIIGWLSVFIQVVMGGVLIAVVAGLRWLMDDGRGLIKVLNDLNLLVIEQKSMSELVELIGENMNLVGFFLLCLVFLFIGILFLQLILVILTIKVHTLEEASSIQSPFYIVLLILYYVAMFLNNQESMTNGIGYVLSFLPVSSMIFMPSRILIYHPSLWEVLLSLFISLISLVWIIRMGEKKYCRHVLDTSVTSKLKTNS